MEKRVSQLIGVSLVWALLLVGCVFISVCTVNYQKHCPSGVPCHYPTELVEHPAKYRDLGFAVIGELTFLEEQKAGDWTTYQYRLGDPRFWKDASILVKLTVARIPAEYKDDPYEWKDVVCWGIWKQEENGYSLDAFSIGGW